MRGSAHLGFRYSIRQYCNISPTGPSPPQGTEKRESACTVLSSRETVVFGWVLSLSRRFESRVLVGLHSPHARSPYPMRRDAKGRASLTKLSCQALTAAGSLEVLDNE